MSKGWFVTGTDTGVGKTVIAAALTLALPGASYWKPIQSGIEGDPATDSEAVAQWTGSPVLPEAYRLRLPASPHVSAAAEGVTIERARLRLPPAPGPVIAEGAGGTLVPINADATMADLMTWLRLPIVLVARTSLGTLNHTLLSLEALRARQIDVRLLVLNGPPVPSTTATLRAWAKVERLVEFPLLDALTPAALRSASQIFHGLL